MLAWEEPARNPNNKYRDWAAIVAELKENPGRWALLDESMKALNHGFITGKGLQMSSTSNGDGTYRVYVRWPED